METFLTIILTLLVITPLFVYLIARIMAEFEMNKMRKAVHAAIIHDVYYDAMTDNDDIDDPSTFVKVTFNELGEVLDVSYYGTYGGYYDKNDTPYPWSGTAEFRRVFGIHPIELNINTGKRFSRYDDEWRHTY